MEQALRTDEHAIELAPALSAAQSKAVLLLTKPTIIPTPTPESPKPEPTPEKGVVGQGSEENLGMTAAKDLLSGLDRELRKGQSIRLNVSWIIEEGGDER